MGKLTLSIDEQTIRQAKQLAAENKTSLSSMVARFIQAMAAQKKRSPKIGTLTQKATGVVSLKGRDYKDVLSEAIAAKHKGGQ